MTACPEKEYGFGAQPIIHEVLLCTCCNLMNMWLLSTKLALIQFVHLRSYDVSLFNAFAAYDTTFRLRIGVQYLCKEEDRRE